MVAISSFQRYNSGWFFTGVLHIEVLWSVKKINNLIRHILSQSCDDSSI